ncbi:hypothetical protein [[Scytonema hofmanni] UTEX B 1581]|nr:hypothetical protein [[Scytonema hofmanni] UTEX B 1581]
MLMVASGRKLTDLPEAIKSLANRTLVVHGLVGTYELLTLHDVGDQLSRRSVYVHFPRYHADITQDIEIFQSVVWGFQLHMPLHKEPDLVSHWDYCYERSLGCVGILKNWLSSALASAITSGATTVEIKHLEQRALSVAQCRNILKKIKEGESNQAQIEAEVGQLRAELGLPIKPALLDDSFPIVGKKQNAATTTGRKVVHKVGQPLPKRRQVGT